MEELILQFGGLTVTVRSSGSAATASATTSHPREAPPPSSSSDFAVVSEPVSARVPLAALRPSSSGGRSCLRSLLLQAWQSWIWGAIGTWREVLERTSAGVQGLAWVELFVLEWEP